MEGVIGAGDHFACARPIEKSVRCDIGKQSLSYWRDNRQLGGSQRAEMNDPIKLPLLKNFVTAY